MERTNRISNLILDKGRILNAEIKNNLMLSADPLIDLMLVDFVLEAYNNYDRRLCQDYEDETPIIPEGPISGFITEITEMIFTTETGIIFIPEFVDVSNPTPNVIEAEDGDYFQSEGEYKNYIQDRDVIMSFLNTLTKDLNCNW